MVQCLYSEKNQSYEIVFNYEKPVIHRISENLNTFNQLTVSFDCWFSRQTKKKPDYSFTYHMIYHQRDQQYLIDDGSSIVTLKSMQEVIQLIRNSIKINDIAYSDEMLYNYRLIFVNLDPPFKMFETDSEIGNIVIRNKKIRVKPVS
jgi:hypothetical protein